MGYDMKMFYVILEDETGKEFTVNLKAYDRDDAWETVQMDYPECSVVYAYEARTYVREY